MSLLRSVGPARVPVPSALDEHVLRVPAELPAGGHRGDVASGETLVRRPTTGHRD